MLLTRAHRSGLQGSAEEPNRHKQKPKIAERWKNLEPRPRRTVERKNQTLRTNAKNKTSSGDANIDLWFEKLGKADAKYDSKQLNEKALDDTMLTQHFEVGAPSKARNNVILEEKVNTAEPISVPSLQEEARNDNHGIFIVFQEREILDHFLGGQVNVMAPHIQTKPLGDWDAKELESQVEVEGISRELEQAQLVVDNMQSDLCKDKGYESDNNTNKRSKFKFSGEGIQKAQRVITCSVKKNI